MSAPGGSTWDGNPNITPPATVPYRPGKDDFNGIALEDDAKSPPDASKMPTSALLNTWSALSVVFGRMIPNLVASVAYVSGSPALDSFTAAPSAVDSSTLTVARTGGGASHGDVTVSWPANTFPAAITQPLVSINGTTPGIASVSAVGNGVRIVIQNTSGTGVDLPFTVTVN